MPDPLEPNAKVTTDLGFALFEREAGGLIRVRARPMDHGVEQARQVMDLYAQIVREEGCKVRALIDMRPVSSFSRDARVLYQGDEGAALCSAAAMMVDSGASRVIGNFIIGLNRGPIVAKLFTDEGEAWAWLESLAKVPL